MAEMERIYRLVVDGTSAGRELEKIARTAGSVDSAMSKLSGGLKTVAGMLGGAALLASAKQSIDALDSLSKSAQAAGVSVETLSGFQYVADMSGVSAEALSKSLGKLSRSLADLAQGSDEAKGKLGAFGIEAGDSVESALGAIADKFASMPDGVQKTAAAIKLFGDEAGPKLVPMLNAGRAGIAELMDEARGLGLVMDGEAARAAEAFNDNLARMRYAAEGVGRQFLAGMLPALQSVTDAFTATNTGAEKWQEFGRGAGEIARWVAKMFLEAGAMVRIVGSGIAAAAASVATRSAQPFRDFREEVGRIVAEMDEAKARLYAPAAEGAGGVKVGSLVMPGAAASAKQAAREVAELTSAQKALIEASRELARLEAIPAMVAAYDELALVAPPALAKVAEGLRDQLLGLKETAPELEAFAQAQADLVAEMAAFNRSAELEAARLQLLSEWFESGSAAQQEFARKMLEATAAIGKAGEAAEKSFGGELVAAVEGWSRDAAGAILDFATGAERDVGKAVEGILRQFARLALQTAMNPVFKAFSGWLAGFMPAANGAAFAAGGGLVPFAAGGVVNSPAVFGFAGGVGVMGEAGPEAIMPLRRGADGRLGVSAASGGVSVVVNNYTEARVKVSESKDAAGGLRLDLAIEQAVGDGLARGKFDSILGATFGLTRRGR